MARLKTACSRFPPVFRCTRPILNHQSRSPCWRIRQYLSHDQLSILHVAWFELLFLPHWNGPDVVQGRHATSSMYLSMAMLFLLVLTWASSVLPATSESPPTSLGKWCSVASNRLDPRTKKFMSDCDAQTFCSGTVNGTCVPRQCRRDEFLFRYRANETQPGLCPEGSFCPDEGDACRPLVAVGQPCQFNRDDQCAPSDMPGLADYHNFNGAICLNSICT